MKLLASLVAFSLCLGLLHAAEEPDYPSQILQWRTERIGRLTGPESWLTLVGLEWLKPGETRLGSAKDNQVILSKGPAQLGRLILSEDRKTLHFIPGTSTQLRINDQPPSEMDLLTDENGKPSVLRVGSLSLTPIRRGERVGLRIRDKESEGRLHFSGLNYFPIDPSWRIAARWVPFEKPRMLSITNVIGQTHEEPCPGKAVFEREGKTYELFPTEEDDGKELFFVLRDKTSGKETYGASRFLYAKAAANGIVILDFNMLYNPPCAFTDFATCPLPIPENRLMDLPIHAGERKYEGHSE
jgi:uncharacterized protein (DUF1684 family)